MPEAELLSRPPEEAVPLHERLRARHAVLQWRSVDSVVFALSDPIDAVLAHEIYSNEYENSGDWNVLVVDESFAAGLAENGVLEVRRVDPSNAPRWFEARRNALAASWQAELNARGPAYARQVGNEPPSEAFEQALRGLRDMPLERVNSEPYFVQRGERVRLLVAAVPRPLLFAAALFGGWNQAPDYDENAVLHSYWSERHGATPMFLGSGFLEFWVERPPTDMESCGSLYGSNT
ncbi:MAG: DUF4253 domain-containing protein [Myxococcota bacterium]